MRGHKTGGRQVGTPNKVTTIFKEAVRNWKWSWLGFALVMRQKNLSTC